MEFEIEVDGWQLFIKVTRYQPETAGRLFALPEDCYPPEPAEVEFEVDVGDSLCAPEDHCTSEEVIELDELEYLVLDAIKSLE